MTNRLLLFGFLLFSMAAYGQDRGAISGIVTLSSSGEAVENVTVTIRLDPEMINGNGELVFGNPIQTTTDQTGHFLFKDSAPGTYQLTMERAGSPGFVDSRRFITVRAKAEGAPLAFSVSFPKTGTITGAVQDNSGKPVAGVTVLLVTSAEGPRQSVLGARTNARGEYRLNEVPPGKFKVLASPDMILPGVNDSHEIIRQNVSTFYPRTTVERDASLITLVGGEELNDIDITLQSSIP